MSAAVITVKKCRLRKHSIRGIYRDRNDATSAAIMIKLSSPVRWVAKPHADRSRRASSCYGQSCGSNRQGKRIYCLPVAATVSERSSPYDLAKTPKFVLQYALLLFFHKPDRALASCPLPSQAFTFKQHFYERGSYFRRLFGSTGRVGLSSQTDHFEPQPSSRAIRSVSQISKSLL
jgi:hypothetical protein